MSEFDSSGGNIRTEMELREINKTAGTKTSSQNLFRSPKPKRKSDAFLKGCKGWAGGGRGVSQRKYFLRMTVIKLENALFFNKPLKLNTHETPTKSRKHLARVKRTRFCCLPEQRPPRQ